MNTLISFVLRVLLMIVGLASAACIALGAVVVLLIWVARRGWAQLTGRPMAPFNFRFNVRRGFPQAHAPAAEASRTPRADAVPSHRKIGDVTDVEAKSFQPHTK